MEIKLEERQLNPGKNKFATPKIIKIRSHLKCKSRHLFVFRARTRCRLKTCPRSSCATSAFRTTASLPNRCASSRATATTAASMCCATRKMWPSMCGSLGACRAARCSTGRRCRRNDPNCWTWSRVWDGSSRDERAQ